MVVTPWALVSRSDDSEQVLRVPLSVKRSLCVCLEWLRKHGTGETGLFRVAGDRANVRQLFVDLVLEGQTNIARDVSIATVASLTKVLLRRLPETILSNKAFADIMAAAGTDATHTRARAHARTHTRTHTHIYHARLARSHTNIHCCAALRMYIFP